ncbi:PREDICTED: uncharacterized protein LOC105459626, partial [Wasmannia auropunctata]|uniref:uncharacterized protein LOC105459626 n=1 Tax=Wasmannia auropunctata TaxID=64793 RepID=UPI0005EEA297
MNILAPSGYKDFLWAVELHHFGFEIIGLWPKTDKFARLWSEIRISIILILLIFVLNIPMIYTITQIWDDMVLVINNLQTTLPFVAASVKYVIMRWKRTVFSSIVNMMAEDWMVLKLDAERNVMIRQARIARLIMIIGYFFVLVGFFALFISSYFGIKDSEITNFTNADKQLPLQTYYFYDINKSPQYELTYFIHFTTVLFGAIIYMCIDIFLILITLHICGQLENFRCRLSKLVSCKDFNKTLNNITSTHLRLIRYK